MKNSFKISLRKANFSDIEFLWYLRNQPDVYKYSRRNRPVSWKEHTKWILPILLRGIDKKLFVIQKSEIPVGQIRFDYKNRKEAEVSVSILKEFRKKGFAKRALNLAIKELKKNKKTKLLTAKIHKNNLSSIKLFEKLGFKFKTKKGNWLKYVLIL